MKSGVVTPFAGSARGPADRRGARPRVAGRRSPREPVTADAEELGRGGVETRAAAPAFDDAVDVRAGQGSPGERPRRQAHPRNVVVHDVRRGDGAVFLEVDASERVVDDLLGTDCCRGRLFLRAPVRGLSERRRAIGLRSSELPAPSDFAISAVAKKSYAPAVTCAKRRRCAGLLRTSRSRSLSGAPRDSNLESPVLETDDTGLDETGVFSRAGVGGLTRLAGTNQAANGTLCGGGWPDLAPATTSCDDKCGCTRGRAVSGCSANGRLSGNRSARREVSAPAFR